MQNLVSIRTNILYSKNEEGAFDRHQELIFLVDKPTYRRSTEGEIVRERGIEELRFTISDKAYEDMLAILAKLKTAEETDLK